MSEESVKKQRDWGKYALISSFIYVPSFITGLVLAMVTALCPITHDGCSPTENVLSLAGRGLTYGSFGFAFMTLIFTVLALITKRSRGLAGFSCIPVAGAVIILLMLGFSTP